MEELGEPCVLGQQNQFVYPTNCKAQFQVAVRKIIAKSSQVDLVFLVF